MTISQHETEPVTPPVEELIEAGKVDVLSSLLGEMRPPEIADALRSVTISNCGVALSLIDIETAALVFPLLPEETQLSLLEESTGEQLREIIAAMVPDDRISFFGITPPELLPKLLSYLNPLERKNAQKLLNYPPDSIGRLVNPNYVTVRPDWTPEHVLRYIRRYGEEAESFDSLYVIDDDGVLVDEVSLRSVLLADPKDTVSSLIDGHVVFLNAIDDRERAVHTLDRYDQAVLPVVDEKMRMLGIVTFDDIADVAKDEATEDFHKVAGIDPLAASYRETGIIKLFSTRIRWLLILIGVNVISLTIITFYENTLNSMIALAFFLPLLIGSGGNTGSQVATLMIRALATKDVETSQWMKIFIKEYALGICLGLAMGIASFGLGYLKGGTQVGLIISLSMFSIVLASNLIGTLLPFILTKLNIDPAFASSPLVTTLADATGLLIYFSIATSVMNSG
ncbi:MAG TPA: magnesium transporter [Oligoflexia bacterium]|nr:magnesium transporter [Oligoflexia bacterium]HMP49896.1 magnesium transporter [Oligoflexia bacterium]